MSMSKNEIVNLSIEIVIKLVLLGAVLYWALLILKPFLMLVIWAIIIAVTLSPLIGKLEKRFTNQRKKIIISITIFGVLALLVPSYFLSESVYDSSVQVAHQLKEGSLVIPAAPEKLESFPRLYTMWNDAANNMDETLQKFAPQLQEYGGKLLSAVGSILGTILQFAASLIIAAVFLMNSDGSVKIYHAISRRLLGEKGIAWANLSALTVRSVVQGVLGIALIQATLALIGLLLIKMPLAPLWAFVVLFLAIIQLPPILILGPLAAYAFSYTGTTPASIFLVYSLVVSTSDAFLKPLLLGRGVDVPMLVILLGAIGGMILSGIIGLFVGAVILALAYKLFTTWLDDEVSEVKIFK